MKRSWIGWFLAATSSLAVVAVVARWRRGMMGAAMSPASPTESPSPDVPAALPTASVSEPHESPKSLPPDDNTLPIAWQRWAAFVIVVAVSILILVSGSPVLSLGGFVLLTVVALVVAYRGRAEMLVTTGLGDVLDFSPLVRWISVQRAVLSQDLSLVALVALAASAYLFRPDDLGQHLDTATLLFLGGGLALGGALWLRPGEREHLPEPTDAAKNTHVIRWVPLALGLAGMALLAEISGMALKLEMLAQVSMDFQFALLCISCTLVVWGLAGLPGISFRRGKRKKARIHHEGRWLRWEVLFLAALVALALGLRLWELGTSIRTLVDELHFTSGIMDLRIYGNLGILQPMSGLSPFPWIYPYWQSFVVNLLGRTLFGFRATSAFLGTLTVVATYLLARTMFDRKTAVLAGILLAVFPPSIHFSRLGIIQIADPLFATLGFAFIGRGLMQNRRLDYVIGGVMIGFSQYFYEAGRLLFPLLTTAWLIGLVFLWRKRMDVHRRGLGLMLVAFLLMTIPIYYTLVAQDKPLTGRLDVSGSDAAYWEGLFSGRISFDMQLQHFEDAFLVYVNKTDIAPVYYGGSTPLILVYVVPFFMLGVWYAVWRLRSPGMLLLVLWVLSVSLGTSLLAGTAFYSRYLVVHPALALFIAVGIRYALPLILPMEFSRYRRYALTGALVVGLGVGQVGYYFGPHLAEFQIQSRLTWDGKLKKDIYDVVLRSASFPAGTRIHVLTADPDIDVNFGEEMMRFFADGLHLDRVEPSKLTPAFFAALKPGIDHAFFLAIDDTTDPAILRTYLNLDPPQVSPYPMPPGTQMVLYYASVANNPNTLGKIPDY